MRGATLGTRLHEGGENLAAPADDPSQEPLPGLQAAVNDSNRSFAERIAAVGADAALGGANACGALKSIGLNKENGGAVDYEVKRKVLQALAGLGEVVSLPAVSRTHADEILKSLSTTKPQAAIFDYDGTSGEKPDSSVGRDRPRAESRGGRGVQIMILSARSDRC